MDRDENEFLREGLRTFIVETQGALRKGLEKAEEEAEKHGRKNTAVGQSEYRKMKRGSKSRAAGIAGKIRVGVKTFWYTVLQILFSNAVTDNDPASSVNVDLSLAKANGTQQGSYKGEFNGFLMGTLTDVIADYETLKERKNDEKARRLMADDLYETWKHCLAHGLSDYTFVVMYGYKSGLYDREGYYARTAVDDQLFANDCRTSRYRMPFKAMAYAEKMFSDYKAAFGTEYAPSGAGSAVPAEDLPY